MADPTLLTFTVTKNEGPFIHEWVAWQRLMGVDRILVFSNDCDDGTDTLLDELDRLGISYARHLRLWRDAGCVSLSDVDEFSLLRGATCP